MSPCCLCILLSCVSSLLHGIEREQHRGLCIRLKEEARSTAHGTVVLIDGTLCPTWSWRGKKEMYNGKHHRTGHTLTVISTLEGQTVYICDSYPGATHDKTASTRPDVSSTLENSHTAIGDNGYQATPCLTPYKNHRNQPLTTAQQQVNSQINKLRAPVERATAQLKT
nr:transposase family protein [Natronoglycomyces albus]